MQRVASRPRLAFDLFKNLYKSVLFTTWEFKTGEQHLSPCCWLEKMKSSGKALDWLHLWCLFVVSHLAGSVDHCRILLALMAHGSASPVFPISCTGRAPSPCVCAPAPLLGWLCPFSSLSLHAVPALWFAVWTARGGGSTACSSYRNERC